MIEQKLILFNPFKIKQKNTCAKIQLCKAIGTCLCDTIHKRKKKFYNIMYIDTFCYQQENHTLGLFHQHLFSLSKNCVQNIVNVSVADGQDTIVLAHVIIFTVISVVNARKTSCPVRSQTNFRGRIAHADRTKVWHWASIMKLPLLANLFSLYPHLCHCIVGDWY